MFSYWIKGTLFLGLLGASLSDIVRKEVPDYLSGFLIALGLISAPLSSYLDGSLLPLLISYGTGGLAFLFGYGMFKASQWGGGDTKLITGSALLISQLENGIMFFIGFFMNLFIVGSVIGIASLVFIALGKVKKILKDLNKARKEFFLFIIGSLILAIMPFFLDIRLNLKIMFWLLATLFLLIKPFQLLEDEGLREERKVGDLIEGDWVIERVVKNGEVLYSPKKSSCITKEGIKRLKEHGIKEVKIKRGIPFVPSFFISFLITIFYKNLFFSFFFMA